MYKAFHRMFGAYVLSVPEEEGIRLINLLTRERHHFWGMEKKEGAYFIKASLFSCEGILKRAKSQGFCISITKAYGLPFVFAKYKGRWGLIMGSLCGFALIFYSQLFIWEITVTGNEKISTETVIKTLEEYGVKPGAFIPALDIGRAESKILLGNTDISSISVNIKGTYANIAMLERSYPPELPDYSAHNNIVASRDGIVILVEAVDGVPEVKAGDVVIGGQLLINAFIDGELGSTRLTNARGRVIARVTEEYSIEIPLVMSEKVYTGQTETKTSFRGITGELDLFFNPFPSFERYDISAEISEQKLFGFVKTSVFMTKTTFLEYKINSCQISPDAAELRAREAFSYYLKSLEGEVISYDIKVKVDEEKNACVLTASVVVHTDIAQKKPVVIGGVTLP